LPVFPDRYGPGPTAARIRAKSGVMLAANQPVSLPGPL
jgi:hypothetical protein